MSNLPDSFFQKTVWDNEKNPIWVSSTLTLSRNFFLYKFPEKMTPVEMNGSLKVLDDTLHAIPSLSSPTCIPAEELTPLDKELLFEHFQCTQSFQETQAGQGFAFDSQGQYLLILNFHNHLQLHYVGPSEDLIRPWTLLTQIHEEIGKGHPYAFSPRFGYLTADPMSCGTALKVTILLHVPALYHTKALAELFRQHNDEQILFLSLEGSIDDLVGDFLVLRNHYTLGVTEETILNLLQTIARKMIAAENATRESLKSKPSPELKDFVGRSLGLLMHSYQLQPKEALEGLSGLKLGIDLGWVSGISAQKLATLMLQVQRGHLTRLLHLEPADSQTVSHKRAEWLHQELKGITMTEQ